MVARRAQRMESRTRYRHDFAHPDQGHCVPERGLRYLKSAHFRQLQTNPSSPPRKNPRPQRPAQTGSSSRITRRRARLETLLCPLSLWRAKAKDWRIAASSRLQYRLHESMSRHAITEAPRSRCAASTPPQAKCWFPRSWSRRRVPSTWLADHLTLVKK
jgi:hypothetical protein